MKKSFLGIDTSNYMTSICYIDENRRIIYEGRKLLEVKKGEKGLKQSDALFQHIKNMPELFKEAGAMNDYILSAICVSKTPRPVSASYMPVFLAGTTIAESMAYSFDIPLIFSSHQEGHISAGLHSLDNTSTNDKFICVHLSGGTSEFLEVEKKDYYYNIKKLGGTLDLHAGQLIDRVGVLLGLPFPSGAYIEKLAKDSGDDFQKLSTTIKDFSFHLSGAETEVKKRVSLDVDRNKIARSVENVIANSVVKVLNKIVAEGITNEILFVGGVAQNQYIRDYLVNKLEKKNNNIKIYFAKKKYSGDNAFGIANIAVNYFNKRIK